MNRVTMYIDGFNLYFGLKSKGWRRLYWLNVEALAENLLKSGQKLVAVKYFTARISANTMNPSKVKRQNAFLEAVKTLSKTQVFYGQYLPKPQKCYSCGATWTSHEEKMTDVNISVEMMKDAFDDTFDTALLLSADSDLAAPVAFLKERYPWKRIIMVCPPDRQSMKLESLVDATFRLGRKKLQDSQFPDRYTKPDGFTLERPMEWK